MTRATDNQLDELHAMQAEALLAEIKRYKDKNEGIPPALFAQANKFLKDNGVDRAVSVGDPTDLLEDELPEFSDNVVNIKES